MVRIVVMLTGITFLFLSPGLSRTAMGMTGDEVLTEIQKRYEQTAELEAGFIQEYISKSLPMPQKGEGRIYLKKKGMMRWDYRKPNQKLISNGKTLWFYQAEENQVMVSDIAQVVREKTPLAFLSGEGDIRRDFTLAAMQEPAKEPVYVLELTPNDPEAAMTKLILAVDKKSFWIVQADVFDGLGNVSRTRFSGIKTNVSLSASFFEFKIPKGAEVLRFQEPAEPFTPAKGTKGK
jgi:outer membrane lipoprotein carrier protein